MTVENEIGLHARPATVLAESAGKFASEVFLVARDGTPEPGKRVDAKSVLELILLGAPNGSVLEIEAVGPDAERAVQAIAALFADRFGTETRRG